MKKSLWIPTFILSVFLFHPSGLAAQTDGRRYIDVIGVYEMDIVPDEIHFDITIQEYYEEEFDGKSKPEEYRTKVQLEKIENDFRYALRRAGIPDTQVRVREVGDYWRSRGREFLVSKSFDITLNDFGQIDRIVKNLDTKGIRSMNIGSLKNRNMVRYHEEGKRKALLAARKKAAYMLEALGEELGEVLTVQEHRSGTDNYSIKSGMSRMNDESFGRFSDPAKEFRLIHLEYSVNVRFAIAEKK